MNKKINEILGQANKAREDDKMDFALEQAELAFKLSQESDYVHGIIHALLNKGKINKLQYQKTKDRGFLLKMNEAVQAASAYINEASQEDMIAIWSDQAEVESEFERFDKAVEVWQRIIDTRNLDYAFQGRAYEHLAKNLYKSGKKDEAVEFANKAVEILEQYRNDDDYTWKVWYSGALMTQYLIFESKDTYIASEVKTKIEDLLKDDTLIRRRRQWKSLIEK